MKLTLAQVMDLEIMEPAIVKTGDHQLGNKYVEWVSITEAPVENFIRKNELVLTTGIGYGHDPKQFYEFVRDVIKSEASGLAIATGRYIYELYEDSKQLAEQEEFPIIFLPWEIRFADLTQAVTAKLIDAKQENWQYAQRVQQELLSLMLAGNQLSTLAEHIADRAGSPIAITDHLGTIKGVSTSPINSFTEVVASGYRQMQAFDQSSEHHPLESKVQVLEIERVTVYVLPIIQANERIQGYLFTTDFDQASQMEYETFFILLEHAVTAAAFWFLQENAVQEAEARLRDDFVADLSQGTPSEKMKAKAKGIGYNIAIPYLAIVGMPHNLEEMYTRASQVASYSEWLLSMVHYMEGEIYYAGTAIEREIMSTFTDGQLLIYLAVASEDYQTTVNSFLDLLDRRLSHLLPDVEITWGIGDFKVETDAFEARYLEAKQALLLGIGRMGPGSRIFYSDTRIDRVLNKIGEDLELRTLIEDYAAPLLSYDKQRGMDLIGTFIAYQRNQNKVSQTARVLHLHRQSLLYRLRKIESLTGLSLANPDDVFLLDLSIRTSMIKQNMQTPIQ